jgi:hypothetical protein
VDGYGHEMEAPAGPFFMKSTQTLKDRNALISKRLRGIGEEECGFRFTQGGVA